MIKKELCVIIALLLLIVPVSATSCNLGVKLINQDPYPITPGENVKVVFQVTGVENKDCGIVGLKVIEQFPFTVDPSSEVLQRIHAGTFVRDYPNFWLVPFKLRVNSDAKESTNELEILVSKKGRTDGIIKKFDIEIKDVQTDFEVYVRDYNPLEKMMTIEVVNIGDNDVESLVLEIPEQDAISLRGSNTNVIGILDSNEDTTARFRVDNVEKGEIEVNIRYNDLINERRIVSKKIFFDPSKFEIEDDERDISISTYLLIGLIVLLIIYWIYKRNEKKKKMRAERKA